MKHGWRTLGLPPDAGTVTIHFSCYLEDTDEPYDSSILRGRPERFKLDDGRLIPGMEIAVKSMHKVQMPLIPLGTSLTHFFFLLRARRPSS